ncbi:expressed protein [Dictyostelium purpureum]|uniref:Expressed protein n=1 Tax=Dictyostelium purpureum TaxID=5786 RepID=F0ZCS9_DICPU|nr:uncharacterized protein DICPUDRAFT_91463 [Dictyostelium purpureum]EGC38254.1 expressed protein [Dictyostelium purpureum]|eukprot:XP_003285211.1 expressed protein [Dictyostelium purpureum]
MIQEKFPIFFNNHFKFSERCFHNAYSSGVELPDSKYINDCKYDKKADELYVFKGDNLFNFIKEAKVIQISKLENIIFQNTQNVALCYLKSSNSIPIHLFSIQQYKMLLSTYPLYPGLKLSKSIIKKTISSESILFLKQLFQNGFINNNTSNDPEFDQLLSFTKKELMNHNDYKYINWINK